MTDAFDYDKLPTGPDGRKHCKTRDGRDVTLLCNDAPGRFPLRGWIDCDGGSVSWTADGGYTTCSSNRACDLVMPSRKRWVNLYGRGDVGKWIGSYETREYADIVAGPDRIACVEVEL